MWAVLQKLNEDDYCILGVVKDEQVASDFIKKNPDLYNYTFCPDIEEELPIKELDEESISKEKVEIKPLDIDKLLHLNNYVEYSNTTKNKQQGSVTPIG